MDRHDPAAQVAFWPAALGYASPPPDGFATCTDWHISVGGTAEFDGDGSDRIEDAAGRGPRIWFQPVPDGDELCVS